MAGDTAETKKLEARFFVKCPDCGAKEVSEEEMLKYIPNPKSFRENAGLATAVVYTMVTPCLKCNPTVSSGGTLEFFD